MQDLCFSKTAAVYLNAFTMHVCQLFDFERPLEASGKVVASAHDEQRLLLVKLFGYGQNAFVLFEYLKYGIQCSLFSQSGECCLKLCA